jgi:hypothetical protein
MKLCRRLHRPVLLDELGRAEVERLLGADERSPRSAEGDALLGWQFDLCRAAMTRDQSIAGGIPP